MINSDNTIITDNTVITEAKLIDHKLKSIIRKAKAILLIRFIICAFIFCFNVLIIIGNSILNAKRLSFLTQFHVIGLSFIFGFGVVLEYIFMSKQIGKKFVQYIHAKSDEFQKLLAQKKMYENAVYILNGLSNSSLEIVGFEEGRVKVLLRNDTNEQLDLEMNYEVVAAETNHILFYNDHIVYMLDDSCLVKLHNNQDITLRRESSFDYHDIDYGLSEYFEKQLAVEDERGFFGWFERFLDYYFFGNTEV